MHISTCLCLRWTPAGVDAPAQQVILVTAAGEHEHFRRLRERLSDLQAKGIVMRIKSRPPNDAGQVGMHQVWLQHRLVVNSGNNFTKVGILNL